MDTRRRRSLCRSQLFPVFSLVVLMSPALGRDHFVAPDGKAGNAGTEPSPWDIASALSGEHPVQPGDTIYLAPGTYRRRPDARFAIRLVGTAEGPIHVRPVKGARATIDGGLSLENPSAHVWVWDLEILVSENFSLPREIDEPGSHPESYKRPWGGLHTPGGSHSKFINLVIHDCAQGVSSWTGATDIEIYGCLIHENGWQAPDRGHGHSIYTQNRDGTKTVRHCILSAKYPGSYTVHAYGSARAWVDNYLFEENIAHGLGPFLIGGGRPSQNIRALRNVLHDVSMRVGYNAPHNENCEVRGNVVVNGDLTIQRYRRVVDKDNRIVRKTDPRPEKPEAFWFVNRHDPQRAHLAVFNWPRKASAEIEAGPFLSPGDRYRLLSPRTFFGQPLGEGRCQGKRISVPVDGEFGVFVVLRRKS